MKNLLAKLFIPLYRLAFSSKFLREIVDNENDRRQRLLLNQNTEVEEAIIQNRGTERPKEVKLEPVSKFHKTGKIAKNVIIFCDVDYHVRNAAHVIRGLESQGISACAVDMSFYFTNSKKRQLSEEEWKQYEDIDVYDHQPYIPRKGIAMNLLKAIVVYNDTGYHQSFIVECRRKNILTFGVNEGVQDFLMLGEGVRRRTYPYRACDYVILAGEFDKQFFEDRVGKIKVGGIPSLKRLLHEPIDFPKKPLAVINVNFSYNVLSWKRQEYVASAVLGCQMAGIDYVITQHPTDKGDLSDYNVGEDTMYNLIKKSSVFISRFSTGILESLALGKPAIYHNPHDEQVVKFQKPMSAYEVTKDAISLKKAIKKTLKGIDKQVNYRAKAFKFLDHHALISDDQEPGKLISDYITAKIS